MACKCLLGQLGRLLTFSLLAGGCLCAYLAASSCEFFSYESKEPESLPGPFLNLTAATVGIFSYYNEAENECTNYDEIFTSALDANDFNAYFVTAQFAAVIGPACAAVAWLINLVEWLFWSNTCTYQLVVLFLIFSFAMQGITFMVYGQTELCFDDRIAGECKLEFGAYMSIAASAAFYFTSIVWCCMPRSPPFCIAQGNQGIDRAPENGKDYHEFYAANTFETTTTNPPQELENQHDYYTPSGETTEKPWADSDNRPPIPSVPVVEPPYAMTEHVPVVEPPYAVTGHVPPSYDTRSMAMTTTTEMPAPMPDGFQDHTAQWMGHDTSNPMNATHDEPFANPFVVEEPMAGAVSSPGRPAYGNLQG